MIIAAHLVPPHTPRSSLQTIYTIYRPHSPISNSTLFWTR